MAVPMFMVELLADRLTLVLAKSGELRLVVPALLLIGVMLVAGTVKLKVLLMLSVPAPVLVMVRPLVGLLIGPVKVSVSASTWKVTLPSAMVELSVYGTSLRNVPPELRFTVPMLSDPPCM